MKEKKTLPDDDARLLDLESLERVQGGDGATRLAQSSDIIIVGGLGRAGLVDGWCGNEPRIPPGGFRFDPILVGPIRGNSLGF